MKHYLFYFIIYAFISVFLLGCCGLKRNNEPIRFFDGFHESSGLKDDIFLINNVTNSWCNDVIFEGFIWAPSPYESLVAIEKMCNSKYPEVKFCIENDDQNLKWYYIPENIDESVSLQSLLWRLDQSSNIDVLLADRVVFIGYYWNKLFLPYTVFIDVGDANGKIIEDVEFGADTLLPVLSTYIQDGLYAVIIYVPYKFLKYNNIEITLSDEIFKSLDLYAKRKNSALKTKITVQMFGSVNNRNFYKIILQE